jgi:membrane protein DedA with SNARE-associated domain
MSRLPLTTAAFISTHQIDHLLGRWGYGLLFVVVALQACGAPLPGTTALAAAAIYAASTHRLAIPIVIVVALVAAVCGNLAGFALGRWGGLRLLQRYGRYLRLTPARIRTGQLLFDRHGGKIVFVGRFITGLRNLTGLLAGTNGMPLRRFLLFAGTSAAVWAVANGLAYFYLGDVLTGASLEVTVILGVVGVAWLAGTFTYAWKRARRLDLTGEAASSEAHD